MILAIKKRWYDMILSGEKKEEYREIKPYYRARLQKEWFYETRKYPTNFQNRQAKKAKVMFRNGYSKNSPSFIAECSLSIGTGKEEWGAEPGKKYYVLHIHRIEAEG